MKIQTIKKDIKEFKGFIESYTTESKPSIKLLLANIITEQFKFKEVL